MPRMVNCIGGIPVHQTQGGAQGTPDFGRKYSDYELPSGDRRLVAS